MGWGDLLLYLVIRLCGDSIVMLCGDSAQPNKACSRSQ